LYAKLEHGGLGGWAVEAPDPSKEKVEGYKGRRKKKRLSREERRGRRRGEPTIGSFVEFITGERGTDKKKHHQSRN